MTKSVSVHIVTYNSEKDIRTCLEAVCRQQYPISSVIIIDNNSSDKTVAEVDSLKDMFRDRLQLVRNAENTGFAPAHNQGIHLSSADYIVVLNPDVTLEPDYIGKLVEVLEGDKSIGSATGMLLRKEKPELLDSTGITMNSARRAFDRGAGQPSSQWRESGDVFGVSGAAAVYARRMVDDVSIEGEFFDSSFFAYKEDVDVAWRASLLGWGAYYRADALGYHERGWKEDNRSTKPLFLRQLSYINRYKMMYKNDSLKNVLKSIPKLLPYELASHAYFLIREPGVLKAWGSFFRERRQLQQKRRMIQNKLRSTKRI
ncbi:glycosyltransferase family 2 protein [Paenibacillus terreus]|uniref:Glycosyltransferase family 2 protein n=1 Tax=Paenibacillus terreus TaxID=1387834 RepID=A0ABV5BF91_9BACL